VVTSPEAAVVLAAGVARCGGRWRGLAAVGAATAKALQAAGLEVTFAPSKATAKFLAAELPFQEEEEEKTVLYPASALAAATLETGLSDRGFEVQRVDAYTTLPAHWDAEAERLAQSATIASFGSPSAVKVWAERLQGTPAACIGETSATAATAAGCFTVVNFPEKPGIPGWTTAIIDTARNMSSNDQLENLKEEKNPQ
jgi:uroporphyrinogen-III synthase